MQITFADTKAISQEITYPDNLIMTITLPELFVDAETGTTMQPGALSYMIPVGAQYTQIEYE